MRDKLANGYSGFVHIDACMSFALWIGAQGAYHTPTTGIGTLLLIGKSGEAQRGECRVLRFAYNKLTCHMILNNSVGVYRQTKAWFILRSS